MFLAAEAAKAPAGRASGAQDWRGVLGTAAEPAPGSADRAASPCAGRAGIRPDDDGSGAHDRPRAAPSSGPDAAPRSASHVPVSPDVLRPASARTAASIAPRSFGMTVKRSGRSNRSAMPRRQSRAVAGGAFHRVGELRRVRRRHRDHRHAGPAGTSACGGDADGGMRIREIAACGMQPADFRLGAGIVQPEGVRTRLRARCQAASATGMRPVSRKPVMVRRVASASRSSSSNSSRSKFELTWMSMLGDSDGSTGAIDMSLLCRNRVRMSLRFDPMISRVTGSPIRPRRPGGEDIAEIAGRHAERDLPVRRRPAPARRRRSTAPARRCAPS